MEAAESTPVGRADELAARLAAAQERIKHLETALETNRHIARAIGIVMARWRLDEEHAFVALRTVSQHRHVKLRDLAEEVVYTGEVPSLGG